MTGGSNVSNAWFVIAEGRAIRVEWGSGGDPATHERKLDFWGLPAAKFGKYSTGLVSKVAAQGSAGQGHPLHSAPYACCNCNCNCNFTCICTVLCGRMQVTDRTCKH